MKAALCATVKNEEATLLEWIVYHSLIGFECIILIDDGSIDGTRDVALAASRYCDVRLIDLYEHGANRQHRAYERVCRTQGIEFEWIAFMDLDEYLVPRSGGSLSDLLAICDGYAGIGIPWLMFGSSGHESKPSGLIIDNYRQRSEFLFGPNRHVKSIVRPDRVQRAFNPHAFETDGGYGLPNGQALEWQSPGVLERYPEEAPWMVHHYFTRSRADWQVRLARGQLGDFTRTWDDFVAYDRNEVMDLTSTQLSAKVRSELRRIATASDLAALVPFIQGLQHSSGAGALLDLSASTG